MYFVIVNTYFALQILCRGFNGRSLYLYLYILYLVYFIYIRGMYVRYLQYVSHRQRPRRQSIQRKCDPVRSLTELRM